MLVAKEKRKENIAEYILYLYQIEDLIRAFKFDIDLIQEKLVASYNANDKMFKEITDWYSNLVIMMNKEGVQEKGHLQFIINQTNELNEFHLLLLKTGYDKMYVQNFQEVSGLITELRQKNLSKSNDIQTTLDAIYGFLLLKLKKAEISEATFKAIKRLSQWLAMLAHLFKKFEAGDLEL